MRLNKYVFISGIPELCGNSTYYFVNNRSDVHI